MKQSSESYEYKVLIFNEDAYVLHQYCFDNGSSYEINNQMNFIRWIEPTDDEHTNTLY